MNWKRRGVTSKEKILVRRNGDPVKRYEHVPLTKAFIDKDKTALIFVMLKKHKHSC